MRKIKIVIANFLWLMLCLKQSILFKVSTYCVSRVQKRLLLRVIRQNQYSDFGGKHNFSRIGTIKDFKRNVPVSTYETYVLWIDRIQKGERNVLTAEEITILEPTSGSINASKFIPYNKNLRNQFKAGISPWIFDLFISFKKLISGSSYWSITPVATKKAIGCANGIKIGFKDDSEYFGKLERLLINSIMAVPSEVSELDNIDNFRYATLLFLLRDRNLSFISVWNPTFLVLLLDNLSKWLPSLIDDVRFGTISLPADANTLLVKRLSNRLRPDKKRAKEIEKIYLSFSGGDVADIYESFWPNLMLISCWGDGHSLKYLQDIAILFPNIAIQPKGLLATEGIISFPLNGRYGSVLAVRSHFFEFIEYSEDNGDKSKEVTKLINEIEIGKLYSVVITTGGGLYRYRLGDIIEVVGFENRCPLIRFIRRENNISDFFGEKLNEEFVEKVLKAIFNKNNISPKFFMMAPEQLETGEISYITFIELSYADREKWRLNLKNIESEIEQALEENYHYAYCRKLGQLASSMVFLIERGGNKDYLDACCSFGQRLGDVKSVILHKKTGWTKKFSGNFIIY